MDEHFHDPTLKAAVGRLWGCDMAPDDLRSKIETLAIEHTTIAHPAEAAQTRAGWGRGIAIAALVLIAAGIVTVLPWGQVSTASGQPLPRDVVASMIRTHDRCCKAKDHHLLHGIGRNDFIAIGFKLSRDLKVPVLSTSLENWKFEGAGGCSVWGHESAHLLYRNRNDSQQTLSVFSMPVTDFAMAGQDADYSGAQGTHQLAAFVKDGGLYCVVINSPIPGSSAQQTQWLRDQLRGSFAQTAVSAASEFNLAPLASASR